MSISDIEIPQELSKVQRSEYLAYKEAMLELEDEWHKLLAGENIDQKSCIAIITDQRDRSAKKIEERLAIRRDIIQKQYQKEVERVDKEFEAAKSTLYDKLVRAYSQSDQNITAQLKDFKGKDFAAYIAENQIDFPQMPPDTQMMTRTKQPEEVKIRLTNQECEKELRKIQQIFESSQ